MTLIGRALTPVGDSLLVEDEHGMIRGVALSSGARLAGGAVFASGCKQGGRGEDDGLCDMYYLMTIPVERELARW
jgi:hypothetical protein